MSHVDRALGLARSLITYHAIPLRQRRLRALYRAFVAPGDLVFDIGAHAGNRVRAFTALGCRVVAVEPQPDFASLLRAIFSRSAGVEIVEAAVAAAAGTAQLLVSDRTPTVSTLARRWQEARSGDPGFAAVRWNRTIEVATTTLDALIARFGPPCFIKIDVEGAESVVLAGLTRAVPAVSFEYLTSALDGVDACAERLLTLGPYRFNWSPGESSRLVAAEWQDHRQLLERLKTEAGPRHGDVYARLGCG